MSEKNYKDERNQNIDHSSDENGVQPGFVSEKDVRMDLDYEDEDELERIPLEQEPTLDDVMSELGQKQQEMDNDMEAGDGEGTAGSGGIMKTAENTSKGMGRAAMILGIVSILLFCIPVVGQLLALAAFMLGISAAAKNKGKKMGISGTIMGAVSLIAAFAMFLGVGDIFDRSNVDEDTLVNAAWRRADDGSVLYLYGDGTFIHVDREGVFTDNFFSGTYVILSYEDANLSFTDIENQYDTEYAYDVYLYVDQYVSNGEESENIAGTIRYLYMFDKKYSDGDAVAMCAHDSGSYGDITPALETEFMKPTIGNRYEGTELAEDDFEENGDTLEAEAITTEAGISDEIPENSAEGTTGNTNSSNGELPEQVSSAYEEASSAYDEMQEEVSSAYDEMQEEASSAYDEIQEEVSSAYEEASSAYDEVQEEASSAYDEMQEEASSAAEEMNDVIEDISNDTDVNQFVQFFRNLWQSIRDFFSNLEF